MPTLAPPPPARETSRPLNRRQERKQVWLERFLGSRYFLVSTLISLVIFIPIAGWIMFEAPPAPVEPPVTSLPENEPGSIQLPPEEKSLAPEPTVPTNEAQPTILENGITLPQIIVNQSDDSSSIPIMGFNEPVSRDPQTRKTTERTSIEKFHKPIGGTPISGPTPSKPLTFVCYVARYGEGGDWAASLEAPTSVRQEYRGSIPNLLRFIKDATKGRIQAKLAPSPLRLDSNELFEKKPPFIFFNGRKDFVLSDKEIENLRAYLVMGGAIWGDGALAGEGSRFDVAFRREMKRVLPDEDKQFEIVPDDHAIFTGRGHPFYTSLKGVPLGMNFYQQPLEMIKMDGEIAVLYTPNDYGDMMRMAFKPGSMEPNLSRSETEIYRTPAELWDLRQSFYRGFEPENSRAAFELGQNIVMHFLYRFQEKSALF